ncbi:MAG: SagB/ThcOx family dehydrogenase [Cyanobacteria bacterium P01_H01_bin.119]
MPELHVSIAQHYHERTKYTPEGLAHRGGLDMAQQPLPYKTYGVGTRVDLQPYLSADLSRAAEDADAEVWWRRLSKLLIDSYGITARVDAGDRSSVYLRAAPSAGGLYPAELYLISRGTSLLPAGLYNYQVRTHSLLRFWSDHVWQSLQKACFWHPALEKTQLTLVVTAVFQRSAWRYEDRAYRRIFLDGGHLLGNLALAGALTDYRPHLIGGFADSALNQLLYLDEAKEGAIAVLALADLLKVDQNLSQGCTALPSSTQLDYPAIADGELLPYLHQATCIDPSVDYSGLQSRLKTTPNLHQQARAEDQYNFPFGLKVGMQAPPIHWGHGLEGLDQTLLRRRSTRQYSGATIGLSQLKQVLGFAYRPEAYRDQGIDADPDYFDLNLIETFVAVSGVAGLDEGCYYYAPHTQELRQVRFKNFRRELHYLCLQQSLGRDAAAVVFQTADLKRAVTRYGDRVYRYLHMDAGHLGQRLNVAAVQLSLGVSGIAGFFDHQVNEVLGIPAEAAVLYITTIGQPAR